VAWLGDLLSGWLRVQNPARQILDLISDSVPRGAADPIRQQLEAVLQTREPGLVGLTVLGALWVGAGGGATLLKAMNRIFGLEETRPWWERHVVGLSMGLLAGSAIVLALLLLAAGQLIGQALGGSAGPGWFWAIAGFARWPLLVAVLMTEAMIVFRVAPNSKQPWRWATAGAVLFAAGWLLASSLFVVYVNWAGGYASSYGVLGGVVVLLLWLQVTAYALLVGAELNAVIEQRTGQPASPGFVDISEPAPNNDQYASGSRRSRWHDAKGGHRRSA
jgi:membrane protein